MSKITKNTRFQPFLAFFVQTDNINGHQIAKSDEFLPLAVIGRHETAKFKSRQYAHAVKTLNLMDAKFFLVYSIYLRAI